MSGYTLDLLKSSDLMTALTRSLSCYIYGQSVTAKKAGFSVAVSVIARIISDNFPMVLGGDYTSASSKNQLVVAAVNGLAGAMMKMSPARTAMDGVAADLEAEWVLKSLGQTFGADKTSWDYSLIPVQTVGATTAPTS